MKKCLLILFLCLLTGCMKNEYTVTFDTLGGSIVDSIKVKKGSTIENIEKPTKEGYIFVSWHKNGIKYNERTPVTEDLKLTAFWTEIPDLAKSYKVVFDVNNKKNEVIVDSKETVKKPDNPSLKYYDFVDWYLGDKPYDFNTPVTKDLYLVAKFKKKILTVTYEVDSTIQKIEIEAGDKITKPNDPVKKGYKFIGWYYLGKVYNFNLPVEKNIKLTAKYEPLSEEVTIKYVTASGSIIDTKNIKRGEQAPILSAPTVPDMQFLYWGYQGKIYNFGLPVNDNLELVAIYKNITNGN